MQALTIKRSPAKATWGVWFGSTLLEVTLTKWEAIEAKAALDKAYPHLGAL